MRGVSDTKWPGHLIAGTRAIWCDWLSSNRAAAVHSLEQIYKVDWHFFWLSLTFVWGQSHRLLVLERALMKEILSILLIFSACFVLQAEPDVTGTQHTWLPKLPAFPTLWGPLSAPSLLPLLSLGHFLPGSFWPPPCLPVLFPSNPWWSFLTVSFAFLDYLRFPFLLGVYTYWTPLISKFFIHS